MALDRPEPRLQAAWHDNTVCGARSRHRKIIAAHLKRRRRIEFLDFMNSVTAAFPGRQLHVRQPQHPLEKRALAQGPPQRALTFHANKRVLAQSGRGMVLDLQGKSLSGASQLCMRLLRLSGYPPRFAHSSMYPQFECTPSAYLVLVSLDAVDHAPLLPYILNAGLFQFFDPSCQFFQN